MTVIAFTVLDADGNPAWTGRCEEADLGRQAPARMTAVAGIVDVPPDRLAAAEERRAGLRRSDMRLTPRQLFIGLHRAGFITPAEAVAAATTGAMPSVLVAAIATLGPADRADVEITWARMTVVLRTDPLVTLLAAQVGASAAVIDAFFETYSEGMATRPRRGATRVSTNG